MSNDRKPLLNVRLCLFCEHFSWSSESMWGMGSTLTGPMMEGGHADCAKGVFQSTYPESDDDWRAIILHGVQCKKFKEREDRSSGDGERS
jgi:hypothetical protein